MMIREIDMFDPEEGCPFWNKEGVWISKSAKQHCMQWVENEHKWHDIKFAPYDTPRRTGRYLVLTENGVYAIAKFWGGEAQKWAGQYKNCIKAWKEIEKYEGVMD